MKNILAILLLSLSSNAFAQVDPYLDPYSIESFRKCMEDWRNYIPIYNSNPQLPPNGKISFYADPPVKSNYGNGFWYTVNVYGQTPFPRGEDPKRYRFALGQCSWITQPAGAQTDFASDRKTTDQRLDCSKKSTGSVIDFGEKTVVESLPVEGTNLSLNYSSAFNNFTNANRKIKGEYGFFKNIRDQYDIRAYSLLTSQLIGGVSYSPIVPFRFSTDIVPPENSWIHNSFSSAAKIRIELVAKDYQPSYCYTVYYPNPENESELIYVPTCEIAYFFEDIVEDKEKSLVLYHPEVWGMHGWTLSGHHYFDKDSKTLFSGSGEKIQYSNFKTLNDQELGMINVVISKYNEQELFVFDHNGRHLETRDAIFGHVIHKFSYDANNRLISVADRFNSKTTFVYSGSTLQKIVSPYGVETSFQVSQNRLMKAIDPEGFSYEMTYDSLGLLKTYQSINGVQTTFTYNGDGEFLREEKNNGLLQYFATVLANGVTEFTKYANFGLDRKVLDRTTAEDASSIELDDSNNEISRTVRSYIYNTFQHNYAGDSVAQSFYPSSDWESDKIIVYQNVHNVTESGQNVTNQTNYTENKTYDESNSVLKLRRYETVATTADGSFRTTYDKTDNSYRYIDFFGVATTNYFNSDNLLSSIHRLDKYPTNFQYDNRGRLTKVLKGTQFESYAYDSNGYLASTNNQKNQLTQYIRNKKGQLITKILPNQDLIQFQYTDGGEIKKIIAPNGQVHNFQMSLGDYVTQAITPSNKSTIYDYDNDKRLISVLKPSGKSLNYEYEPGKADLKRIVTSNGVTLINSRDIRSRINSITSADNIRTDLTWASNQVQSQSWYDNGQLIAKLSNNFAEDQFRIKSIYLNDNLVASYSYQNGFLRSIDNLGFDYINQFGPHYHTQNILNNRGFSVTYTEEDSQNGEQPEQFISARVYDGPEAQLYITLKRAYDNFGQATEFTTTTLNQNTGVYNSYFSLMPVYDANNRLVQINKTRKSFVNGEEVNSWDFVNQYLYPAGSNNNVKTYQQSISVNHTQTPIKRTFASHNNDDQLTRLQGSINRDYKYNEDGEVSELTNCYGTTKYEYDSFGNLKKVIFPDGKIVEYKVDAFNRRFKKLVNGEVSAYYLWYDQIRLAAILDGNKNPKAIYVYGAESANVPGYIIKDGKTYKIIHDPGTQSVRYIVDSENAMIVQESEYDEHGNIMKNTNAEFQPLGFAGGLYDSDTELIRFGARDYDPKIGRWTTKDPIGFAGGDTNLYAYVGGNPMSYNDPTGLAAICSRPLEGLDRMVNGQPLDLLNLELSHQNIFYDDGGNIGFFKDGVRPDKHNKSDYTCKDKHYDDNIMKKAVEKAKSSGRYNGKSYGFISNNCQDFLSNVLYHYQQMGGK